MTEQDIKQMIVDYIAQGNSITKLPDGKAEGSLKLHEKCALNVKLPKGLSSDNY